jgi:hypothetical protein
MNKALPSSENDEGSPIKQGGLLKAPLVLSEENHYTIEVKEYAKMVRKCRFREYSFVNRKVH